MSEAGKGDLRTILNGLFPTKEQLPRTLEGRDEVRAAVDALLRIYDRDNARLTLALEQLDKGAAEIERLRADNERLRAALRD